MNTDKILAESIAKDYAPKDNSKIVALKKLDSRAKLPATIFTYTCGIVSALVFGTGMCLAMQVIGSGIAGRVLGIIVGVVGLIGCGVNYPIYPPHRGLHAGCCRLQVCRYIAARCAWYSRCPSGPAR